MADIFERTKKLIGDEGLDKLHNSKIIVFGVGGVGGYVCEALARSGVVELHLVDGDVVSESNINRQIIATMDTLGKSKVQLMKARIKSINEACKVYTYECFVLPGEFFDIPDFSSFSYVVDAVDTVAAKLAIIEKAKDSNVPVISSMGTGNKLDPLAFEITDISKTSVCPLAKVVRKALREKQIRGVDVLYSKEEPIKTNTRTPGSVGFVPPVAGMAIAGFVVKKLINLI